MENRVNGITLSIFLLLTISTTLLQTPKAFATDGNNNDDRIIEMESIGAATTSQCVNEEPEENTITCGIIGNPIEAQSDTQIIIGTPTDDVIHGSSDNDNINARSGNDFVFGEDGDDTIQGANNDDQLYGEDGIDVLMGGGENDYLSGGNGNDQLFGGDGDDTLRGGAGANFFNCGGNFDTIVDFDPQDGDTRTQDCEVIDLIQH